MGTWVDLSKELPGGSSSPARTTPVPFGGESDYMRMLREAQVVYHPLHKHNTNTNTNEKTNKNAQGGAGSRISFVFHLSRLLQYVETGRFCISITATAVLHPSFENT